MTNPNEVQKTAEQAGYSMEVMFEVSNRNNCAFGIKGYNHPHHYADPNR